MGTKREYDSGRFDILGRRIKESGKKRNARAQEMRTTQEALDDFQRIATEFNSEVENAVEFGMNKDAQGLNESAMKAAYFFGLYKKWSSEVEGVSYEDAMQNYARFRKDYGLGEGHKIRIDPQKMYETIDEESVQQAQEAIYDVLVENYADRFTEEELNSYHEKVHSYRSGGGESEEEIRERYEQQRRHEEKKRKRRFGKDRKNKGDYEQPQPQTHNGGYEDYDYQDPEPQPQPHGGGNGGGYNDYPDPNPQPNGGGRGGNGGGYDDYPDPDPEPQPHGGGNGGNGGNGGGHDDYDQPDPNPYESGNQGHEDYRKRKARGENIYSQFAKSSSTGYRAQQGFGGGNPTRGSGRPTRSKGAFGVIEDLTGLGNRGAFRVTWRPRIGPFVMNMGRNGPASISADMGPLRYMVWQRNRGFGAWFSSFDLPSILSFRGNRK